MRALTFLVPGDIETRTGGYGYDRRIIKGLRDRGWTVDIATLHEGFPHPTIEAREHATRVLAAIPDEAIVVVDGLAFGAMDEEAERERARLQLVALVHHPLAAETGFEADIACQLQDSERKALATTRLVIVTSPATAHALAAYGVPSDRIVCVEPGTDRAALSHGSGTESTQLLSVASVVPRKGHEVLVNALANVRGRPWHLTIVGSLDRDPSAVRRLRRRLEENDLIDRVTFAGDLDESALAIAYDRADVFVLPSFYEGYGMAVAEALARGLPVISTPTGGIPDLVADDAGFLVPAGDVAALASALSSVINDEAVRTRLADGARRSRERLPTWDQAAKKLSAALDRLEPFSPVRVSGSSFSPAWLTLREAADVRARSTRVTRAIADALPRDRTIDILDLGAGTGSNARYLTGYLRVPQRWLLVDRDPDLLDSARGLRVSDVTTRIADLADIGRHADLFAGRDLVTASALLDLVSAKWLHDLVAFCRDARAFVLFALSYDGRIRCSPAEPEDEIVRRLVNQDQRTDKGFGPALGPDAANRACRELEAAGYRVVRDLSDWVLGPDASALQRQLVMGWADAAAEISSKDAERIAAWRERRLRHVLDGRSHLVVGHEDLAAFIA